MKIYRFHRCEDQHPAWADLAACIWSHAAIDGDGRYGAVACGAHTVTLYATIDQAQAHTHGYDRDGCRPGCYGRHTVADLGHARDNARPPKCTRTVTRLATTPVPPPPKPDRPTCGRPRTNGQPCRRPAGWGADPGEIACRDHGGSITQRLAEKERRVDQALAFARTVPALGVARLDGWLLGSLLAALARHLEGAAT